MSTMLPASREGAPAKRTQRALGFLPLAASMVFALACATPYDPFKVPATELRERIHTVALRPLIVEHNLVDVDRVRAEIEPRAILILREAGFEVVPAEEWQRRWLEIAEQVGPLYDPATGERDDERYEAVVAALEHDLAVDRSVDAVVNLYLYTSKIDGGMTPLDLCGRESLPVYWPDNLPGDVRLTVSYGACLEAAVFDLDDRRLYGIRNGLEWIDTYALQTHASRPRDTRIRDLERLEEALEIILGPLSQIHGEE